MQDEDKISLIRKYAEDHPSFDTTFVDSLEEFLDKFDELTEAQSGALDNIIYRFRMSEDGDDDDES